MLDLNHHAKSVVDEATSERRPEPEDARDPAALSLGRRGGLVGGKGAGQG